MESNILTSDQTQWRSKTELNAKSNDELFALVKNSECFKKVMVEFIFKQTAKSIQVVHIQFSIDKQEIRELGLTERLKNCLLLRGFSHLTELQKFRKSEVLKFRGIGQVCFEELEAVMDRYGFKFVD